MKKARQEIFSLVEPFWLPHLIRHFAKTIFFDV